MALDIFDILGDKESISTKSVVGTLFGTSPDVLASQIGQQNLANTQQTAMAYAQMDPMQRAQYAMFQGAAGGTGGLLQAVGAENPQITRAKQSAVLQQQISQLPLDTPEGQKQAIETALQAGRPEIAIQLRDVFLKQGKTQADIAKAERVDTSEVVDQGLYAAALKQAKGDPIEAAQIYKDAETTRKRSVAAAGAPASGMVKLPDLATAKDIVTGYVKPYKEKLDSIGVAVTNLKEAYNNPQAVPQLRQALTTLTGKDNQTSAKELAGILGSMGLAGNVVESINTVLTGKPTKDVLNNAGQAIRALEQYYGTQYNAARQQGASVLGEAKLNPTTQSVLLPPVYKLPEPTKPKTTGRTSISFSDLPK